MQPGRHQLWIAEAVDNRFTPDPQPCRLLMYSYNGRLLGQRMLTSAEVLRAQPVEEAIAQYLLHKYSKT